jgi:hypothetical protein
VPEESEALVEKLNDYVQRKEILLLVLLLLLFVLIKEVYIYIVIRTFTKMH